jgi:formylglycine-generating enzyme required for sulfatase activity
VRAKKNSGGYRVLRGGCYFDDSWDLRVARRSRYLPEFRNWVIGFRLVIRRKA